MIEFLEYQKRWIRDNSLIKLYEKSRRVGITFATSYRSVTKCLREKEGSTFIQWVSSRDDLTAKQFVTDYVAMWAREANKISREMAAGFADAVGLDGSNVEVVDEKHGITAYVVRFKNGSRINSLSSNPLAFAGKGGDVLIDEWDLHDDQGMLYDMALPCTIMGNQLELVSAYDPNGSEETEFAKKCKRCRDGEDPDTSFHRTTLDDAIDDGYVEMINGIKAARGVPTQTREEFRASLRRKCRNQAAFDSQFMCVPNQASGESIVSKQDLAASKSDFKILRLELTGNGGPLDVIDPCAAAYTDPAFWRDVFEDSPRLSLGWDIAVTGDLASIWINREEPDRKKLLAVITFEHCKLETQRQVIEAMYEASPRLVGCGDKSGLGYSDCVKLELKYADRFEGIVLGATSKLVILTTMQGVFEQHKQMLPLEYPEIPLDIFALKAGKTTGGKLTFLATKNDLLEKSHCDIAISCALAHYAVATLDDFGFCMAAPATEPSPETAAASDFFISDRTKRSDWHDDFPQKTVWR